MAEPSDIAELSDHLPGPMDNGTVWLHEQVLAWAQDEIRRQRRPGEKHNATLPLALEIYDRASSSHVVVWVHDQMGLGPEAATREAVTRGLKMLREDIKPG